MSNKVIIAIVVVVLLLAAVGVGTYLVLNQQNFFSSADQTASSSLSSATNSSGTGTGGQGASCPAPGTPETVTLSYPLCESTGGGPETCQFEKAGCVWQSVSGASSYNVKVTEVETGANIKSETITAPTAKTSFPVVQGRTYKCEVSAVSSCGTAGGTNEDSLLCAADALLSPSPSPTPPPVIATPPPPPPTPPPPSPIACGFSGCSTTVPCQDGYICVQTSVGTNYCAMAAYQSQCYRSPNGPSCCQAQPTPNPTLPAAGATDTTLIIGGAGIGLVILGAAALLLL